MGTLFKDEVWASSYQCFQLITQVISYFFKQVIKYRSNWLLFEGWICNCIQVLFLLACNGHCIKVHLMDFCNSLFVVCCIPLTEVKDNHFFYMIASGIGLLTNKKKALPGWKRRCDQRCNRRRVVEQIDCKDKIFRRRSSLFPSLRRTIQQLRSKATGPDPNRPKSRHDEESSLK